MLLHDDMSLSLGTRVWKAIKKTSTLQYLFVGASGGYWDIQDLTTIFSDSTGTTPAIVDGPVGYIADLSGLGNHLIQATSGLKPTLRQDANGKYYLEFDGVDDTLQVTFGASLGDCTLVYAGDNEITTKYPLPLTTTFDLHTGNCYGLLLINRQLTEAELGSTL